MLNAQDQRAARLRHSRQRLERQPKRTCRKLPGETHTCIVSSGGIKQKQLLACLCRCRVWQGGAGVITRGSHDTCTLGAIYDHQHVHTYMYHVQWGAPLHRISRLDCMQERTFDC